MDDRVPIPRRPGPAGSVLEFVRAAPVMILLVLGLPAFLVAVGAGALVGAVGSFLLRVPHEGRVPSASDLASWGMLLAALSLPSYWLLAFAFQQVRRGLRRLSLSRLGSSRVVRTPVEPAAAPAAIRPALEIGGRRFERIGIVLAGGGAKGVYQAGALQAVHELLERHDAVGAVHAVAGTSIGSWNALFWLGGMMARSGIRRWWSDYRVSELVEPAPWIIPGLSSHLVTSEPWQHQFDLLFGDRRAPGHAALLRALADPNEPGPNEPGPSRIRFYFSRTSVLSGRLAFDTNDSTAVGNTAGPTHDMDLARRSLTPAMVREAVFTSMGIPPLFPYTRVTGPEGTTWSEDGGVVDNLPIRLAMAFGRCDLLFVLPLNSSFAVADRPAFLPTRLWRVIDIRQGLLERFALKQTYLFNIQNALSGRDPIPAFVACPGQPLRISTTELWRSPHLRAAVFEQTRRATAELLESFFDPREMDGFFSAFRARGEDPDSRLAEAGYLRMRIIPPDWERGAAFDEELRF